MIKDIVEYKKFFHIHFFSFFVVTMNNNKTTESYLTVALKRLDDLEGAEKVLQKAHALSPQDPFVLINYAVILEAQGKGNIAAELVSALNDITAVIDVDEQASILFSTFQGK